MISRRTARYLAELYEQSFQGYRDSWGSWHSDINTDRLYDFVFENNCDAWFCNAMRGQVSPRQLKDFIMKLHTGESLWLPNNQDWSWDTARAAGQIYLRKLAGDILKYWTAGEKKYKPDNRGQDRLQALWNSLSLDGYGYKNQTLLKPETEVLEVPRERGVVQQLFLDLRLANEEMAFHHLKKTEDHYMAKAWDDAIGNSRKFLECVLREVAAAHALRLTNATLPEDVFNRPVEVRKYLKKVGLLDDKEFQALGANYGLLSHTGSHPYIAQDDQARLLRQIALVLAQFVMLRFRGLLVRGTVTVSEWSSSD